MSYLQIIEHSLQFRFESASPTAITSTQCFQVVGSCRPAYAISAEILASFLAYFVIQLPRMESNRVDRPFHWAHHSSLRETYMKDDGWCPYRVATMRPKLGTAIMFHISLQGPPQEIRSHRQCLPERCALNTADEETYETKHSACNCKYAAPDLTKLISVIESGGLPLTSPPLLQIEIYNSSGNYQLEVVAYKPCVTYVAVSQVWGDGLGNS